MKVVNIEFYQNSRLIDIGSRVVEEAKVYTGHAGHFYRSDSLIPRPLSSFDQLVAFFAAGVFAFMGLFYERPEAWGIEYWNQFKTGVKQVHCYRSIEVEGILRNGLADLSPDATADPEVGAILDGLEDKDVNLMRIYTNRLKEVSNLELTQLVRLYGGVLPSTLVLSGHLGIDNGWLPCLHQIRKLQTLTLSVGIRTSVRAEGLQTLSALPLKNLYLEGNHQIRDEGLVFLAELPNLETLTIAANHRVNGSFLDILPRLQKLKKLDISGTHFLDKAVILPLLRGLPLDELILPAHLHLTPIELRELTHHNKTLQVTFGF